LENKAIFC
jgi:hypothetical protein